MIELKIEGNYIDSFIYSGSFFLLNAEMQLTSFAWKDVINCIEEDQEKKKIIYNYFSGGDKSLIKELSFEYIISEEKINKIFSISKNNHCIIDFDYWVTDMDIYKNTLFVSSHEGIDSIATNRQEVINEEPKFEFIPSQKNTLIKQQVFDITLGNYSRLIAACGSQGALQINTKGERGGVHELATDEYQLSSKFWINCDWDASAGIAVIKNKLEQEFFKFNNKFEKGIDFLETENSFEELSKEEKKKVEREERQKAIQKKYPEKISIENKGIINSWIEQEKGDRKIILFDGVLEFHQFNLGEDNSINEKIEDIYKSSFVMQTEKLTELNKDLVLETQKTDFGIIIETLEELFIVPSKKNISNINKSFSSITNWRTFPKSKNYRNQLHIVQDDYVSIIGVDFE
ncbi:hypothetical protein [Neisseria dumasiana]|nr:hypothetical protein [Neisseria dumasiana]UOO83452.1 hypothetical protein LVJ88_06910 [Neisseria dumasiana]